jgi:twitching motility protein PilT
MPTMDGLGRTASCEILIPDDAVRNLIRQGKVEQIYSIMQTGSSKGMQTMEQGLAERVFRGEISLEVAMSRSSRPEQLRGLIERGTTAPQRLAG